MRQSPPADYWFDNVRKPDSQKVLPTFINDNILNLKQEGSKLKWEYKEGNTVYLTDCEGTGWSTQRNTSADEKLIGGTWSFDSTKQALTLTMQKESGTNYKYRYILPYAASIEEDVKIVIEIKKSPDKANIIGTVSNFYTVKGYKTDLDPGKYYNSFCDGDSAKPIDESTENKGKAFIYFLSRPLN